MPAKSKAQRRLFAIAEHDPGALYPQNKGLANLSEATLHDFAKSKEKSLPERARGYGKDKRSHHGRRAKARSD